MVSSPPSSPLSSIFTPTRHAPSVRADDARSRSRRGSEDNAAWTPDESKCSFKVFAAPPAPLVDNRKLSPMQERKKGLLWSPRVRVPSGAPLFPDSPELDEASSHQKANNQETLTPVTPSTGWTSAAAPVSVFVLGYRRYQQQQLQSDHHHTSSSSSSTMHHSSSCPCFLPIDIENEEYVFPPSLAPSGSSSPDVFVWGRERDDQSPAELEDPDCWLHQQQTRTPTKKKSLPILPKKKTSSSSSWFGDSAPTERD